MAEIRERKGCGNLIRTHLVAGPEGAIRKATEAALGSLTTNQRVIVADIKNALESYGRDPLRLGKFAFRISEVDAPSSVAQVEGAKFQRVRARETRRSESGA